MNVKAALHRLFVLACKPKIPNSPALTCFKLQTVLHHLLPSK